MAHPAFIIKQAPGGQFYFDLTARNGQVLMTSERFLSRDGCESAIRAVKNNSLIAQIADFTIGAMMKETIAA